MEKKVMNEKKKSFPFCFKKNEKNYSNITSRFLQMLMFRKVVKVSEASEALRQMSGSSVAEGSLERLIRDLNTRLGCYYQSIKTMTFHKTGHKYLILCNSERNEFTESLSCYSEKETAFIMKINNALMSGEKTNVELLNLYKYVQPRISEKDAQEIINKLINTYWLYKQDGIISFGIRSIAENIPEITGCESTQKKYEDI